MWKTPRGPSNVDNPLTRPKGAGWGDGASLELSTNSVLLDKDQWFECSSAQSRTIHCQAAPLGSGRPQIHRQELSLRGRRGAARSPARPPRSRSFSTAGQSSHRHARGRPHPQGVGPGTQKPAAWAPAMSAQARRASADHAVGDTDRLRVVMLSAFQRHVVATTRAHVLGRSDAISSVQQSRVADRWPCWSR